MFANAASPTPNRLIRSATCAALVASVLLSGCATVRQPIPLPRIDSWDERQQVLGNREDWEFTARIAVRASDDGFNGKLRWTQEADAFLATVSGPLGIGTVMIEGNGSQAVLTDKDGVRTELGDVEYDLRRRYGWTIPVKSLRYWALGRSLGKTSSYSDKMAFVSLGISS